jgi:hypothetical protein
MKKNRAILCCIAILCGVFGSTVSYAAVPVPVQTTSVQHLGNGITVETTTTVSSSLLRRSTKSATRNSTYKDNGTAIATVTLNAEFGYNGSTAWVVSASASHWVASGWSYENESLSTSGGTARVTASLRKWMGFISIATVPVNDAITCSKNGAIS